MPSEKRLRELETKAAERIKHQAVEKTIPLKEIRGTEGKGFYYFATDRAPKPGEYKYLNQGKLLVGELIVIFTILTNDGQEAVVSSALEMLKTARHQRKF